MSNIYISGDYLEATDGTWHSEDSPWKAEKIINIIERNSINPKEIVEVGCGAGKILTELASKEYLKECNFSGYDISPQAIKICNEIDKSNVSYYNEDLLEKKIDKKPDILMAIDVFEHVPDYMGFLDKCRSRATYKIYHIPLDVHVSSVIRNSFLNVRYSIGHLHYFTADSAIATLKDTGHEVVDYFYTSGSLSTFKNKKTLKTAIANIPRWLFSKISTPLTARFFGGYSLLVITK